MSSPIAQDTTLEGPTSTGAGGHRRAAGPGRQVVALIALVPLLFLTAVFSLAGLGTVLVDYTQRNDAGFLMEDDIYELDSDGHAVTGSTAEVFDHGEDWDAFRFFVGPVRITARSTDGKELFIGLGHTADVDRYLGAVRRDDLDLEDGGVVLAGRGGGAPTTLPADQTFWRDMSVGHGTQGVRAAPEAGEWSVVIMNADGSAGVNARAQVGARADSLSWIGPALLALGAGTALLTVPVWMRATRR